MIHGAVSSSRFFDSLTACLMHNYRVIRYDRRGYGNSPAPEDGDHSISAQAEDALRVLDERCPDEQVWVFAHSAGSLIALETAVRAPDRIKGVMIMEPPLACSDTLRAELDQRLGELEAYKTGGSVAQALKQFVLMTGDHTRGGETSLQDLFIGMKNMQCFLSGEATCVRNYHPSEQALGGIRAPIALVISQQGRNEIFGRTASDLADRFGWQLIFVEGFHNAPIHDSEGTARAVRAFIGANAPANDKDYAIAAYTDSSQTPFRDEKNISKL